MSATTFASLLVLAASGLAGCPGSDPPVEACVPVAVDPSCAPAYEPSYDQIFANTLRPTCAKSGVSCHSSRGKQGGLAFEDPDEAFRGLHDTGVVRDGDPGCSPIMGRLTSTDGKRRMPPGASLPAGEQCAISRWIANGGKR